VHGEEAQMSKETVQEDGVEITQPREQIIQSTSYKPPTVNIDTIVKCGDEIMKYGQVLEWNTYVTAQR
jgi:hypothetical protein